MRVTTPVALLALFALAQSAGAVITFTQLDADTFVVSHRVKAIGSRGQAMKLVYRKAASLCVAAGFTHYEIRDQESEAVQEDDSANASVRVDFSTAADEDRIECRLGADPEYVEQARAKLAKIGYRPPVPVGPVPAGPVPERGGEILPAPTGAPAASRTPSSDTGGCTVAQITAMARAQLSDDQIVAACAAARAQDGDG